MNLAREGVRSVIVGFGGAECAGVALGEHQPSFTHSKPLTMALSSRLAPFAHPYSWLEIVNPESTSDERQLRTVGKISAELAGLRSVDDPQGRWVHVKFFQSASARWRARMSAPLYEPWRRPVAGISYSEVTAAVFDFSTAPTYLRRPIKKENVVFATATQVVDTIVKGKKETSKTARKGDAIVTGPFGERYVPADFWGIYEDDPNDSTQYRAKPGVRIRAIELAAPAMFRAPWGQWQYCQFGYIVQSVQDPTDMRLIEKEAFELTWYLEPQG